MRAPCAACALGLELYGSTHCSPTSVVVNAPARRSHDGTTHNLQQVGLGTNNYMFGSDHRPVLATYRLRVAQRYVMPVRASRHVSSPVLSFFSKVAKAPPRKFLWMLYCLKTAHAHVFCRSIALAGALVDVACAVKQ